MASPQLIQAVDRAIQAYEEILGGYAARTRPMLERYGYVGALSRIVQSADMQNGFRALRDRELLGITFEAVVIQFQIEFDRHSIASAQWRLDNADQLL